MVVTAVPGGKPIFTSGGPTLWGDAVFIDTELNKPIVILMPSTELPRVAFGISLGADEVQLGETVGRKIARLPLGTKADIPFDILPEIVTFENLNNPASVDAIVLSSIAHNHKRF